MAIVGWARRAAALHEELAAVADIAAVDPRWWAVAGFAAIGWRERGTYVASDAEPSADTFIGHAMPAPTDPIAYAIARAHAAREAILELDGSLPNQRLALTVERTAHGTITTPSSLAIAALAIGDRVHLVRLSDGDGLNSYNSRPAELKEFRPSPSAEIATVEMTRGIPSPFVTIAVGDEAIETARHGHRRGWTNDRGPWLGLSRAGGLDVVSTCHMVVDGYGHAWLAARIAERTQRILPSVKHSLALSVEPLPPVVGSIPLGVAWRLIEGTGPRALPLAYAIGKLLHRIAGDPLAPFSPTIQIPVTLGGADDPHRKLRRNVPAIASVRFDHGVPEPFDRFATRTRALLRREATGDGLTSRLLAAVRGMPAPLAWKRGAVGSRRPRFLDPIADVIAGRACLSRMRLDIPAPPSVAVSSPSRVSSTTDPIGGCVVTVIDDGHHSAITVCGSGLAATGPQAERLLEQILDGVTP